MPSGDASDDVVDSEGIVKIGGSDRIEIELLEAVKEVATGLSAPGNPLQHSFDFHHGILGQSRIGEDLGLGGLGKAHPTHSQ